MNRRNFNIEFSFLSSATNLWIIRRAVGIYGLEYYRSVTTSWWYFAPRESFLILRGVQVCKLSGSRRTIWSKIFSAHAHGDQRFEIRLQINNLEIQFYKWWKTYALVFWIDDEIERLECEINFSIANKGNIYIIRSFFNKEKCIDLQPELFHGFTRFFYKTTCTRYYIFYRNFINRSLNTYW